MKPMTPEQEPIWRPAYRAGYGDGTLAGAAVAFGIIALGEWARRTAAASFAYRRETPLGPSPDFYCEWCDVFDIEPHDHASLLSRGTSVAVGVTSPTPVRVAWSALPVQHDEDDELAPLRAAMTRARGLYPEGATLLALAAECGEVAQAVQKLESADRVRAELLDVAVVAVRLYLGERAR
jgi:hypothetical protein